MKKLKRFSTLSVEIFSNEYSLTFLNSFPVLFSVLSLMILTLGETVWNDVDAISGVSVYTLIVDDCIFFFKYF
jgi:PBP1b-binding outer membrane lipoprotein LpoB